MTTRLNLLVVVRTRNKRLKSLFNVWQLSNRFTINTRDRSAVGACYTLHKQMYIMGY